MSTIQLNCLKPNECSDRLDLQKLNYQGRELVIINELQGAVDKEGGVTLSVFSGVPWDYRMNQVNFLNYVAEAVVKTNRHNSYLASAGMSRLESLMKNVIPSDQIVALVDNVTRLTWLNEKLPAQLPDNLGHYTRDGSEVYWVKLNSGTEIQWVSQGQTRDGKTLGFMRHIFAEPSVNKFCQLVRQLQRFPVIAEFANA